MGQQNKLPKRILIIGMLFVVYGDWNLADMLYQLSNFELSLNFMIFTLPVGIGLLYGKSSSRWWARAWIIFGYFICAFLVYLALANPAATKAQYFDIEVQGYQASVFLLLDAAVTAIGLYAMHRLLFSPKANEYFRQNSFVYGY